MREKLFSSISKLSEGSGTTGMRVFTPHPIFLTLVPRIEKYPSPARGEGQTLDILMLAMVKIISDSSALAGEENFSTRGTSVRKIR